MFIKLYGTRRPPVRKRMKLRQASILSRKFSSEMYDVPFLVSH